MSDVLPSARDAVPLPADSLVDYGASALLWGAGLAWLLPMLGGMTLLNQLVPPERTEWLSRLYCRGQLLAAGCRWRSVVHPDVDPRASYLFAQNHTNHLDHVVLYCATPHFKQGMELEKHFSYPFYGWFMRSRGTIPIRRGDRGQAEDVMQRMRHEIAKGNSLLAFPEGTRTLTGRVGRFRTGMFYLARDLGLPVVPVAVTGMYEVMRKGSLLIRPAREVTVHCEAPIPTAGLTDSEIPALAQRVERIVSGHVDAYWADRQVSGVAT